MENQNNEVVVAPKNEVVSFSSDVGELDFNSDQDVTDFIARVERRNMAIDKIVDAALSRLMPTDFVDMGGKPYLDGVAAERLKKYLGIQVYDLERIPATGYEIIEEDSDVRYMVTYRASYRLGNMVQTGIGIWDTHKKLIGRQGGEYKDIADISLPDLDASARTKLEGDGVSRLLGLRRLTWEYLEERGFQRDKTAKVSYDKGAKGGNAAGNDGEAVEKQNEVHGMLLEMSGRDEKIAGEMLIAFTKSADGKYKGYSDVKKLSAKQLEFLHPKVKKEYDAFIAKQSKNIADMPDGQESELGF